jgi:hypothetical protein
MIPQCLLPLWEKVPEGRMRGISPPHRGASRTDLSPRFPHVRISSRPAHRSEIMTSGWCAGGRVRGGSLPFRHKVCRMGSVRRSSRCQRTDRPMRDGPRSTLATHEANSVPAMRHGMLPLLQAIRPKSRSAGEAKASFICGLPASGQSPRRPRFVFDILRGESRRMHPLACARPRLIANDVASPVAISPE